MNFHAIHVQLTEDDKPYFHSLKQLLIGRCKASFNFEPVQTPMDGLFRSQKHGHKDKLVISTSEILLRMITKKPDASLTNPKGNFAGSVIEYMGYDHLFLAPLAQIRTVSYGKFLLKRYLGKFLECDKWFNIPKFEWDLFDPKRLSFHLDNLRRATFIAIDIENDYPSERRCITCVGFTSVRFSNSDNSIEVHTVVVPFTDEFNIEAVRQFCATLPSKVLHNGKFDIAYLLRFGIPITNYSLDTINLFHSWYSELPKALYQVTAFCLRKWTYWKDEAANQPGSMEYYQYNAKDCFTAAMSCLTLLIEMPQYAEDNYVQEFPTVFPCILAEMTGIKIDEERRAELKKEIEDKNEINLATLRTMVASPGYNPNSSQQTLRLWKALGSEDVKSSDVKGQDKVKTRHPVNRRIVDAITQYREFSSALSKYIAKDFVWQGRCYYALNPHGTDTGRLSSRESAYNTGLQIQNIKRDEEDISVKDVFIADEGFYLGEADYKQNETWYQAYTSGDPNLLEFISDPSKDFHSRSAASFFGLRYEDIAFTTIDELGQYVHKIINKPFRQLNKPICHGAAYNMTASVLCDTMGIDNVIKAKKLLGLPTTWDLIRVCQYLLDKFDETYPILRGQNYDKIRSEINSTGLMVGPTNWTRVCFSNPKDSKRAMNMYAAHKSQSPAAMVLNQAFCRVLNKVWVEDKDDFKLLAQIHDSILFQYRIGRDDLPRKVSKCMGITTPVIDIFGISRNLSVGVDLKGGSNRWSELKGIS